MLRSFPGVRLSLVCLVAVAVALPVAIIGIAKLLLLLCALVVIVRGWLVPAAPVAARPGAAAPLILLAIAVMAASSLWSSATPPEALLALNKHGKLLLIPVLLYLIRSRREALLALGFFVGGQLFLLASSWLLFFSLPLPWAISKEAGICDTCSFAVFSSYLDQSIMTAVLAAIGWHLRSLAPLRQRNLLAMGVSSLALICVFYIFQGRTGHLIAIALVTLAVLWELPRRFRFAVVAIPFVMFFALAASSSKVNDRLLQIGRDVTTFERSGAISTSAGDRLNLWRRALQSIADNPWRGSGAGSWNQAYLQQEARHAAQPVLRVTGNPHQEYLLWGVELGVPGIALLLAILLACYRDSRASGPQARRATQSVLLALALACLFNSALYDALIGDFFCVALALMLSLGRHAAPAHGPLDAAA